MLHWDACVNPTVQPDGRIMLRWKESGAYSLVSRWSLCNGMQAERSTWHQATHTVFYC